MRRLSGQLSVRDVQFGGEWTPLHYAAQLVNNENFCVTTSKIFLLYALVLSECYRNFSSHTKIMLVRLMNVHMYRGVVRNLAMGGKNFRQEATPTN